MRPNFYKADYVSIKDYLKNVDWNDMDGLDTDNSWKFFMSKVNYCIEKNMYLSKEQMLSLKNQNGWTSIV